MTEPVVPHSRTVLTEADVSAASAVLASGQIAHGARARRLEDRWCEVTGMRAAAAVGSGLAALRLALLALDVGPGDDVVVPAYSCVALLNAPLSLGATPILADVADGAWTLDAADVRRRVTERTKAVVAVHLFGQPAPIPALQELGIPIVEDCAHGVGGSVGGRPFGGGASASISSFYATKMIGAGEGGIVAFADDGRIGRVRAARDYGDRLPDGRNLNDKLTDVEAAIALSQLDRLPSILAARQRLAQRYDHLLAGLAESGAIELPTHAEGRIWYRYATALRGRSASAVCASMRALRVNAEQPVWDLRACQQWRDDLSGAAMAFDRVVSLPLYPSLSEAEQDRVVNALTQAVG